MKCPKCGSKRIKRSHSRNFQERLQKLFNKKTYRCIDCDWRGIFKVKASRTKRDVKKYILIKITIIIVIIIAIYLIISHLDREESSPIQQTTVIYTKTVIT